MPGKKTSFYEKDFHGKKNFYNTKLQKFIEKKPDISRLNISNCKLTLGCGELIKSLQNLTDLDISNNNIEWADVFTILSTCKNLERLNVAGNLDLLPWLIGDSEDPELQEQYEALMEPIFNNQLKHLVIDCSSEQFLLTIIERCSSLKTLNEQECEKLKEKLEASLNQITQPTNTAPQPIPAPQQRVTKQTGFGKKILGTLTLLGKNKPLSQNSSSNQHPDTDLPPANTNASPNPG
jgi:hypothetical protein